MHSQCGHYIFVVRLSTLIRKTARKVRSQSDRVPVGKRLALASVHAITLTRSANLLAVFVCQNMVAY